MFVDTKPTETSENEKFEVTDNLIDKLPPISIDKPIAKTTKEDLLMVSVDQYVSGQGFKSENSSVNGTVSSYLSKGSRSDKIGNHLLDKIMKGRSVLMKRLNNNSNSKKVEEG